MANISTIESWQSGSLFDSSGDRFRWLVRMNGTYYVRFGVGDKCGYLEFSDAEKANDFYSGLKASLMDGGEMPSEYNSESIVATEFMKTVESMRKRKEDEIARREKVKADLIELIKSSDGYPSFAVVFMTHKDCDHLTNNAMVIDEGELIGGVDQLDVHVSKDELLPEVSISRSKWQAGRKI